LDCSQRLVSRRTEITQQQTFTEWTLDWLERYDRERELVRVERQELSARDRAELNLLIDEQREQEQLAGGGRTFREQVVQETLLLSCQRELI
jgi:hypothetical protein